MEKAHKYNGLITTLLLLTPFIFTGCSSTSTDKQVLRNTAITDFRGLTLGSSPVKDMYLHPSENKMLEKGHHRNKTYYRSNDALKFGDITVDEISYSYIDDKLYSININLEQDPYCHNAETLASALNKKYQASMKATAFPTGEHYWKAHFVNLELAVSCTNIFSGGKFFSTSVHISEPLLYKVYEQYLDFVIREDKKSNTEKAASDL